MEAGRKEPRYGNWVSDALISKMLFVGLAFCALDVFLFFLAPQGWMVAVLKAVSLLVTALCLVGFAYFRVARHLFADSGGGVQGKIVEMLVSHIKWDGNGKALDIGCGSGALTIKLARKYKDAQFVGVDYWGANWGYSKDVCEENAKIEGVSANTAFEPASASKLPFPNGTFDLVVSNLTFHEVRESGSKVDLVKEALRVLKKGGVFAFQDLFLIRQYFGTIDSLIMTLKEEGIQEVEFVDTSKAAFIPRALKLPFMVGTIGILSGIK